GGNVYVADNGNQTLRLITAGGQVSTLAGQVGVPGRGDGTGVGATFNSPMGLALDSQTNIYVADANNGAVRKVTSAGVVTTLVAGFNSPAAVAVDSLGTVFMSDAGWPSYLIYKISATGTVSLLAGNGRGYADGFGEYAQFDGPAGIAVDASGNVFIADTGTSTLRLMTPDRVVSTIGGLGYT